MTGGREGPAELNFKGSRCDHEVLGVLEAKTSQTQPYLISKCLFLRGFLPLFESRTHEIEFCWALLTSSHPWVPWVSSENEDIKEFVSFFAILGSKCPQLEFFYFYKPSLIQSPLVIVDSSVCQDLSTIASNSTITGKIHAKIDNWSAQSVHYNKKFHYYEIHYYERQL